MNKNRKKLEEVSEKFVSGTFFTPVVGAEIEFYLKDGHTENITEVILQKCKDAELDPIDVKVEKGKGQYEIALAYADNPVLIADRILKIREIIDADFSAKPYSHDYGSALHIHISMLDKAGENPLCKNGDEESEVMQYSIGGLLAALLGDMDIFAPYDACYERLRSGCDAPSTVSWGGNNRTVALRLPTTTLDPKSRRIEHRVAAADVDPYLVVAAILDGVFSGIKNKILPPSEKIYGDAGLEMYDLPRIA